MTEVEQEHGYLKPNWFSWSQTNDQLFAAAEKVLTDQFGVPFEQKMISCGTGISLNTIIVGEGPPLVLTHGFGAGIGFFCKTMRGLSQNYKVYAIDLLGMGRSSRPPFKAKNVADSEAFFVDSLEAWRISAGLETFHLAGHSFGGYVVGNYALKHQERVRSLLLLSPVGVGIPGEGQGEWRVPASAPLTRRILMRTVRALWSWNFSPQSIVRIAGPFGPRLLRLFTRRRFAYLDRRFMLQVEQYLFHLTSALGSGEHALNKVLHMGAWAKEPLALRMTSLTIPVFFIYGAVDWMERRTAYEIAPKMPNARCVEIPHAGHHLYFDNPEGFVQSIVDCITSAQKEQVNPAVASFASSAATAKSTVYA